MGKVTAVSAIRKFGFRFYGDKLEMNFNKNGISTGSILTMRTDSYNARIFEYADKIMSSDDICPIIPISFCGVYIDLLNVSMLSIRKGDFGNKQVVYSEIVYSHLKIKKSHMGQFNVSTEYHDDGVTEKRIIYSKTHNG